MRASGGGGDHPLVSVLTPSFNQAAWLRDNLQSVACQTYGAIEHVVMDGGSTDGTIDVLQAAEGVHWRSEADDGQADAINKAFAESRGEIIGWLNSDDAYFDCRVVADVVRYFAEHPGVDVIYGHAAQTTADGAIIQLLWVPPFDRGLLGELDFIVQPAAFMRRRVLSEPMLDAGFHFAMDYELWLRLFERGATFSRIDRITAIDRHQPQRKSSTIKDVYTENLARLDAMYGMRLEPEWDADRSRFYIRQRLLGATLLPRVLPPFAFSAPDDATRGVLARQLWQPRSRWPEHYR